MNHSHTRSILALTVAALAAVSAVAPAVAETDEDSTEITIEVAPATLNLRSCGKVVTVHTDILYDDVDVASIYLAGVAIDSWKADDRGYFVAKFVSDDVKTIEGLVIGGLNEFKLVGLDVYETPFWGKQEIMVIERGSPCPSGDISAD
jgi:hypothetical protein